MADLIIVAFDSEDTALNARTELMKMQRDYLIDLEDAVVISRNDDGDVHLHQAINMTALGAVGGTFWGGLIGLLFLNPLVGAALGAGAGALSGYATDIGINDEFMKEVGESLTPGSAALGILVRKMTADKVLKGLEPYAGKGRIIQTSLTDEQEAKLASVLSRKVAA